MPRLAQRLAPVGDFAKDLLEAVNQASRFGEPLSLITDLADRLADRHAHESHLGEEDKGGRRFPRFVDQMLTALETA